MAIKTYVQYNDPIFMRATELLTEADLQTDLIKSIMQDLLDTHFQDPMKLGVGLHAKQIGYNYGIFLTHISAKRAAKENCSAWSPTFWIIYTIEPVSEQKLIASEGCFSVEGKMGRAVPRAESVHTLASRIIVDPNIPIDGQNLVIEPVDQIISGFQARLLQHEYDHTINKFYFDHLPRALASLESIADIGDPRTQEQDDSPSYKPSI